MMFTSYVGGTNDGLCKSNPCQNGGTCKDGACSCATGYSGKMCETCGKYLEPWMYSWFERRFWKNGCSLYDFLPIA